MLPLCALLACIALPALGDVHVVDPGGGPGKDLLWDALTDAHSGDILVLRAGFYGPAPGIIGVTGKALTIVADTDVSGITLPAMTIDHVPAGTALVIRDLDVQASPNEAAGLQLLESAGSLWLEGLHVLGAAASSGTGSEAALVLGGRAIIVRSTLVGANAVDSLPSPQPSGVGGAGLYLGTLDSPVIHESIVRGGDGADGAPLFGPSMGGPGIYVGRGPATIVATDSVVQGGPEGGGTEAKPGQGGDGISTLFLATELFLRGTSPAGGAATAGTPGADFTGLPDNVTTWPAAPRSLELPPLVRSRHAGQLVANGQPGDLVAALIALEGTPGAPLLGLQGVLLVPPTRPAVTLGAIDPLSGGLTVTFVLPELPSGVDGLRVFAQGVFLGQDGLTLGSASAMAWIDERF